MYPELQVQALIVASQWLLLAVQVGEQAVARFAMRAMRRTTETHTDAIITKDSARNKRERGVKVQ